MYYRVHVKFVTFLKTSYKGVRRHNTTTQRLRKLANLLLLIKLEKNKLIHSRHVTMYLYFANTRIYFIQCTKINLTINTIYVINHCTKFSHCEHVRSFIRFMPFRKITAFFEKKNYI